MPKSREEKIRRRIIYGDCKSKLNTPQYQCRICAIGNMSNYPLFTPDSKWILKLLQTCTGLQLDESCRGPRRICFHCLSKVQDANSFIQKIKEMHKTFQSPSYEFTIDSSKQKDNATKSFEIQQGDNLKLKIRANRDAKKNRSILKKSNLIRNVSESDDEISDSNNNEHVPESSKRVRHESPVVNPVTPRESSPSSELGRANSDKPSQQSNNVVKPLDASVSSSSPLTDQPTANANPDSTCTEAIMDEELRPPSSPLIIPMEVQKPRHKEPTKRRRESKTIERTISNSTSSYSDDITIKTDDMDTCALTTVPVFTCDHCQLTFDTLGSLKIHIEVQPCAVQLRPLKFDDFLTQIDLKGVVHPPPISVIKIQPPEYVDLTSK